MDTEYRVMVNGKKFSLYTSVISGSDAKEYALLDWKALAHMGAVIEMRTLPEWSPIDSKDL